LFIITIVIAQPLLLPHDNTTITTRGDHKLIEFRFSVNPSTNPIKSSLKKFNPLSIMNTQVVDQFDKIKSTVKSIKLMSHLIDVGNLGHDERGKVETSQTKEGERQ
jgi:hypothetical protein